MNELINKCEKMTLKMASFKHIEDPAYIKRTAKQVLKMCEELPEEPAKVIKDCLDLYVAPVLAPGYFEFLHCEKYGHRNADGCFEIENEDALESVIYLLSAHVGFLEFCVENYYAKYFKEHK